MVIKISKHEYPYTAYADDTTFLKIYIYKFCENFL